MIAQTALVALVWVRLYVVRLREMSTRRIDPQRVADSRRAAGVLENVAAADNFRNLFEVPVLFFAGCLAAAVADAVTPLLLAFAWAFVGLRAAHSFIHVTYNRVVHRFLVYVLGTLCVFALWTTLAFSLLARTS